MPDINFAASDDVSIAHLIVGGGPIDIVYVQGAWTHLEVEWELPAFRTFCQRLGEFARLIRFDKRGMGSGLSSEDHGARQLKGVPGAWELYAVAGT